jgi:hypothetical protein
MAGPLGLESIKLVLNCYSETSSSESEKLLHEKIERSINSCFLKSKELPVIESIEPALELLTHVHNLCEKAWNVKSSNVFGGLSTFIVKTITKFLETSKGPSKKLKANDESDSSISGVAKIYEDSFTKFMKTKTNFRPTMFLDLVQKCPNLVLEILPLMISLTLPSQKPKSFQLLKAYEIISAVLTSKSTLSILENEKKMELFKQYFTSINETLIVIPQSESSGPFEMSALRVKTIIKILLAVMRKSKSIFSTQEFIQVCDCQVLLQNLDSIMASNRFDSSKGIKTIIKQIQALFK